MEKVIKIVSQSRWRSWPMWLGIAGALGIILNSLGIFKMVGITSETFKILVDAVGTVLVTFGVLNNPSIANKF